MHLLYLGIVAFVNFLSFKDAILIFDRCIISVFLLSDSTDQIF